MDNKNLGSWSSPRRTPGSIIDVKDMMDPGFRRDDIKGQWLFFSISIVYFLFSPSAISAKRPPEIKNELPAPLNVQAVTLKSAIALSWQWPKPDALPFFKDFGFEVQRSDGKMFFSKSLIYQDLDLAPGTYAYRIRARGQAKEKRKPVLYVSDWSERVSGTIVAVCPRPPAVTLEVIPTQKTYSSIPSLRFRLQGKVTTESSCTLGKVRYHLDTGRGIAHDGPLRLDKQGRFDTFVSALRPEDEIPSGVASFGVTVTAENEVGITTSDVYTLDVELQNPYAPR